jgi:hypothetical protein
VEELTRVATLRPLRRLRNSGKPLSSSGGGSERHACATSRPRSLCCGLENVVRDTPQTVRSYVKMGRELSPFGLLRNAAWSSRSWTDWEREAVSGDPRYGRRNYGLVQRRSRLVRHVLPTLLPPVCAGRRVPVRFVFDRVSAASATIEPASAALSGSGVSGPLRSLGPSAYVRREAAA